MKNVSVILLLVMNLFMNACIVKEKVDLIVFHAKVYTINENFEIQDAFAIKDGKFVAVGSNREILGKYQSEKMIDALGKPVYPGFIDAHCHFYGYAMDLITNVDLTGTKSFEDVISKVKNHYDKFPSSWIQGRGWDQNDWEIMEFPTKELLDMAFSDTPVFLTRVDGHAAVVNTCALNLAGITAHTEVEGGKIQVIDGVVTGLLIDNAVELISKIIPPPTMTEQRTALQMAEANCFAVGLTSVHDAGLGKDTISLIEKMQDEGLLRMRIYAMISPTMYNLDYYFSKGPQSGERLSVRSIKLYADGALGSRGAWLIEPYSDDPANRGILINDPVYFNSICIKALEFGFQVNTHAIGDAANQMMLEIYGNHLKGNNDKRWRIEHAQVIHHDAFDLFGKFSIIPSVQPTHATSDMYWAEARLGPERVKGAYAYKKLQDQNGWLPLGTDFPIEQINPIYTFYAAVSRKDLQGRPEAGFHPENSMSREDALRGMTIWGAKAAFEENIKGTIEVGKYADFVILEKDIMTTQLDSIPLIEIDNTYIGGLCVYSKSNVPPK